MPSGQSNLHMDALPQHMDSSIVLARLHQCALSCNTC